MYTAYPVYLSLIHVHCWLVEKYFQRTEIKIGSIFFGRNLFSQNTMEFNIRAL